MFTSAELAMLNDAINMAMASNKRMQNNKPQFHEVFNKIENDLAALRLKIHNMPKAK